MKKVLSIAATLCVLGLAAPAFAADKAARAEKKAAKEQDAFAKYDKNHNGVLDDEAKEAVKKAFDTDKSLKRFDTNGDGKLDDSEVAAIKAAKKGGKKKTQ